MQLTIQTSQLLKRRNQCAGFIASSSNVFFLFPFRAVSSKPEIIIYLLTTSVDIRDTIICSRFIVLLVSTYIFKDSFRKVSKVSSSFITIATASDVRTYTYVHVYIYIYVR